MKNLIRIWKEKSKILEGIKNNIFKVEHIEEIAQERLKICQACSLYDGPCAVKGTGPCCGSCGCSLKLSIRSLSKKCPQKKWESELTFEEEYELQLKLREDQPLSPKEK